MATRDRASIPPQYERWTTRRRRSIRRFWSAISPARLLVISFAALTVGLSMNLTPELAPGGRLVVVVLMFVGRVGVMTLAAALTLERRALPFRYAQEDVAIG